MGDQCTRTMCIIGEGISDIISVCPVGRGIVLEVRGCIVETGPSRITIQPEELSVECVEQP